MARVRPFAAWRYRSSDRDITHLCAPPYDVVSDEERARLIGGDPHNIVALELPEGAADPSAPDSRYRNARRLWDAWRRDGVFVRDPEPSIYLLAQRFRHGTRTIERRALIAEVGLEPFEAGVIIPHERTLPKALGDRFELIKATAANFSQVFGLFEDASQESVSLFEAARNGEPVARAVDADGVESLLWRSTDPLLADELADLFASRRIFIADGHHRYTTALAYRDLRRSQQGAPPPTTDAPYDWVMMALVSMDDPDLVVLPYHRIADAAGSFDAGGFYAALERDFVIEPLGGDDAEAVLQGADAPAFVVRTRTDDRPRLARLRPDIDLSLRMPVDRDPAWRSLDVAIVQELVLWPLLGIHPDRPETLERLAFTNDAAAALAAAGEHDVALVLRPTRLDQLRAVALAGETMPQKSTYFYPKLLSGLVMRSMDDRFA